MELAICVAFLSYHLIGFLIAVPGIGSGNCEAAKIPLLYQSQR